MSTLQTQQAHVALRFLVLPQYSGCIRSSLAVFFQSYGSLLISNCVGRLNAEAKHHRGAALLPKGWIVAEMNWQAIVRQFAQLYVFYE